MLHQPIESAAIAAASVRALQPGEQWFCDGCDGVLKAQRDFCPDCDDVMPCYAWNGISDRVLTPGAETIRQEAVARMMTLARAQLHGPPGRPVQSLNDFGLLPDISDAER